jgi:hypothetical protein
MRIERRATCVLLTVWGIGATLGAGPALGLDLNGFLPGKGAGHVALSVTLEGYDEFWAGTNKVFNPGVGEVDDTTISLYVDYGFSDRLALVANVPSVDADSDGEGGFGENDLQDLTAMLKYRAASRVSGSRRHQLVLAGGFRTPISDYEANLPVDVGDGTTDFLARFIYQLETDRFYFSQQVGFDLRGEDAPDGFPFYSEIGFKRRSLLAGAFLSYYVADGGTDIGDPGFTFPSNQEEFTRVGAKVYAEVGPRLGLSGLLFTTLEGRNTGDITGAAFGVVSRF